MSYVLGVDLGTTYTAAAVGRDGRVELAGLGDRGPTVPSILVLRDDGTLLAGDAAARRALEDPARTARQFKRRLGDSTPLVLGGTPFGAESLTGHLLAWVLARVAEQEGSPPEMLVITHPANYGPFKRDLLEQAAQLAGGPAPVLVPEPVAAAVHYARQERIEEGAVVAVYDFGGGTFDAALVRRAADGFELLGTPGGLERLGGVDFDQAVFAHVNNALGGQVRSVDTKRPGVLEAVMRLRDDCQAAKEALSADTDATITVALPDEPQTRVRITRPELESMISPRLDETITVLERTVASAGLTFADIDRVLLVGGSSRIPVVGERLRQVTGRPVALDSHPKFAVALGAAHLGLRQLAPTPTRTAAPSASRDVAHRGEANGAGPERGEAKAPRPRRRLLIAAGAVLAIIALALATALLRGGDDGDSDEEGPVVRLASDRYSIPVDAAYRAFEVSPAVVFTRGDSFADALSAPYLAGLDQRGPVFFAPPTGLESWITDYFGYQETKTAFIVGDPTAVSQEFEDALTGAGLEVQRVEGPTRFETAAAVARAGGAPGSLEDLGRTAIIVHGTDFVSATAAAPISYRARFPVLLTDTDELPEVTELVLDELEIDHLLVIGSAISEELYEELDASWTTDRIVGTPGETSVALAQFAADRLGWRFTHVNLAPGDDWPEAAAAGAAGGKNMEPTLLTEQAGVLGEEVRAYLEALREQVRTLYVFGDTDAITDEVVEAAERALDL
jgi:putative cell wall-binding protein/actin-like ATPase involved in cell morphogenesis